MCNNVYLLLLRRVDNGVYISIAADDNNIRALSFYSFFDSRIKSEFINIEFLIRIIEGD